VNQGVFRAHQQLILASASPRRQFFLAQQGLRFRVIPSTSREPDLLPAETPVQYAERLAGMKGQDIASGHSNAVVISADTIVVRDHEILGKPVNKDHALDMLLSLSGRWHEVITGFCILHLAQGLEYAQTISSQVYMPSCTREVLESYVATGEPMDKAGAYGIQGLGAFLVGEVRGSYTNVVGLPVREVLDALLAIKAIGVIDAQSLAPA